MAKKRKASKKPKRIPKKRSTKPDANQIAFRAVAELTPDK